MARRIGILCGHVAGIQAFAVTAPVVCSAASPALHRGLADDSTSGLHVSVASNGVATLRFSNERARNPLSKHVLLRLHSILQECAAMDSKAAEVRCVMVASTGSVFCSGHDMKDFTSATTKENQAGVLRLCAEVNMLLSSVPQPTVALVDGYATAGGCQLAASCDLLFATEKSKFCLPGVRSEEGFCHTPTVGVASKIGRKALRINLLADDIGAQDAKELGLVDLIGDLDKLGQTVDTLAKRFDSEMAIGKQTFFKYIRGPAVEEMYAIATPVMVESMYKSNSHFEKFLAGRRPKDV